MQDGAGRDGDGSTVRAFFKACKPWQDSLKKLPEPTAQKAVPKQNIEPEKSCCSKESKQKDLNPHIRNIIMVDDINRTQLENLQRIILTHLTTAHPSVAIGTLRHGIDGWKESASLVQRKIPVLYIDVRQRQEATKKDLPAEPDEDAAKKLITSAKEHSVKVWHSIKERGKLDVLDVCRMAYFHSIWLDAKTLSKSWVPVSDFSISIHDAIRKEEEKKLELSAIQPKQVLF